MIVALNEIKKTPKSIQTWKKAYLEEDHIMMNKTIFEENWKLIRPRATERWSLMADYDLNKVDKAEVKYDKFVTMLRVKYGYTPEKAREEIGRFWAEQEAINKIKKNGG
jgi:hypothetical protein